MWQAEIVNIDQQPLVANVTVLFTDQDDATRTDKQLFSISNLNDLPRICWNQLNQHEMLDNIGSSKVKLGPVDVSSFRPKVPLPPSQDAIDQLVWAQNYNKMKKMELAITQKFKTATDQDYLDLSSVVKATFKIEYLSLLVP